MNLKIRSIVDKGINRKERIILDVLASCDVGKYILMDTTYQDGSPTNLLRHTYWFPDKKVSAGDVVVLYTKKGYSFDKVNDAGKKTHFFYWDLKETVWNQEIDCAVLIYANTWEFHID